mmetsp:Transcript_28555/g.80470  ORF Transcript_28555/g.80470 Transcript_28555/m.80470 type:complete len:571 (+) Transcript_28555:142-1854(+)
MAPIMDMPSRGLTGDRHDHCHHHHHAYGTMKDASQPNSESAGKRGMSSPSSPSSSTALGIFVLVSLTFTTVISSAIVCLSLAVPRLGELGAHQNILLYVSYSMSSASGLTSFIVETWNHRKAMVCGLILVNAYVVCFWLATCMDIDDDSDIDASQHGVVWVVIHAGACVGGIGSSIAWTAQGSYFSDLSTTFVQRNFIDQLDSATSKLGGIFATIYLIVEAMMDVSSSIMLQYTTVSWNSMFALYATLSLSATAINAIVLIRMMDDNDDGNEDDDSCQPQLRLPAQQDNQPHQRRIRDRVKNKCTKTLDVTWKEPKMWQVTGFTAAFGLSSAYINSVVSGGILPLVWNDDRSKVVGAFAAGHAILSALTSHLQMVITQSSPSMLPSSSARSDFAEVHQHRHQHRPRCRPFTTKRAMLVVGCCSCCLVGLVFFALPQTTWNRSWTIAIYILHGISRGTFEGTLKAWIAEHLTDVKEAAFSSLVLVSGMTTALGYLVASGFICSSGIGGATPITATADEEWMMIANDKIGQCVEYASDGSFHSVWMLQLLVIGAGVCGAMQMLLGHGVRFHQ